MESQKKASEFYLKKKTLSVDKRLMTETSKKLASQSLLRDVLFENNFPMMGSKITE